MSDKDGKRLFQNAFYKGKMNFKMHLKVGI